MARSTPTSSGSDLCLYFLAIFVSPIPVLMIRGCGADFIINICLYILGWIPGVIHAWWLIGRGERYDGHAVRGSRHSQTHYQPQPQYQQPVVYQQAPQPVTGQTFGGKY